jgi:hypothetical protein
MHRAALFVCWVREDSTRALAGAVERAVLVSGWLGCRYVANRLHGSFKPSWTRRPCHHPSSPFGGSARRERCATRMDMIGRLVGMICCLSGCVAIRDSSWASPVARGIGRMDTALSYARVDAPFDSAPVSNAPEVILGYERGIENKADFGFGIQAGALHRTGLYGRAKYGLVKREHVEASLGGQLSGIYLTDQKSARLGAVELRVPLRLGWNLSRGVQLGTEYAVGLRYDGLRAKVRGEVGGPDATVDAAALRPSFSATLVLYMKLGRSIHLAPQVSWDTAYGGPSVFLPRNGQAMVGGLHVYF